MLLTCVCSSSLLAMTGAAWNLLVVNTAAAVQGVEEAIIAKSNASEQKNGREDE